jgi:hypothetical protein
MRRHEEASAQRHRNRQGPMESVQAPQAQWGRTMALTRSFKETVRDRAQSDPAFRLALLTEAMELFLAGDMTTGRNLLADYVNATIGYQVLGKLMDTNPKSLMRMLGPKGNPRANNLFGIIHQLQQHEGVRLEVRPISE